MQIRLNARLATSDQYLALRVLLLRVLVEGLWEVQLDGMIEKVDD